MKEEKGRKEIFSIYCPVCRSVLWIDSITKVVVKHEKGKKEESSLDDLLLKEKRRKEEFTRKLEATAEIGKGKKEKAKEKFKKAFVDLTKESSGKNSF